MSFESNSRRIWLAVVLAALVALPTAMQAAEAPAVADVATAGGGISWSPRVSFDKLVLTVQGGGHTLTKEFTGGSPYFEPVDAEGYQLPDGIYSWELTVIPPALDANRANYRSEQRSADGRTVKEAKMPAGLVQSGSFSIAGGAIVDPGLTEAPSARAPEPAAAATDVDDSDAANQ